MACVVSLVVRGREVHIIQTTNVFPILFVKTHRPTDLDKTTSTFCPEKMYGGGVFVQAGSCCTDEEEEEIKFKFEETQNLTDECSALYKQVRFGVCCYTCHPPLPLQNCKEYCFFLAVLILYGAGPLLLLLSNQDT